MDWVLLIFLIAILAAALLASVVLLYYYQDDTEPLSNRKVCLLITIVMGMELIWLVAVLVPSDVYLRYYPTVDNPDAQPTELPYKAYEVAVWLSVLYCFCICPFATKMYTSYDDVATSAKQSFKWSAIVSVVTLGFALGTAGILYAIFGEATVRANTALCSRTLISDVTDETPSTEPTVDPTSETLTEYNEVESIIHALSSEASTIPFIAFTNVSNMDKICGLIEPNESEIRFKTKVTFSVYVWYCFSTLGCVFYCVFGSAGMVAGPYLMLSQFVRRPKPVDKKETLGIRLELGRKAEKLENIGKTLQLYENDLSVRKGWKARKQEAQYKVLLNRYQKDIIVLEDERTALQEACDHSQKTSVTPIFNLILFILLTLLGILWTAQIVVTMILPTFISIDFKTNSWIRLLDTAFLIISESRAGIVCVALYYAFALYLIFCIIYGTFKASFYVMFFLPISRIEAGKTLPNSLATAVVMALIATFGATNFMLACFNEYIRMTTASLQYDIYTKSLPPFRHLYSPPVFGIVYLCIAMISLIVMIFAVKVTPDKLLVLTPIDKKVQTKADKIVRKMGGTPKSEMPSKRLGSRKDNN